MPCFEKIMIAVSAALAIIGSAQSVSALKVGDTVCVEGFIMDFFCINRGTLLDAPSVVSLKNPELHSLHCLLDVGSCVRSGYEVLIDPKDSESLYCRGFRLDDPGNEMVLEQGRATGEKGFCTTCTGASGEQTHGYRAAVRGVLEDMGDGMSTPPTIAVNSVTTVTEIGSGCPEGISEPPACITEAGSQESVIYAHGSLMLIGWGVLLPMGVVFAKLFKHRPDGLWFKIHRGLQITGLTFAIIGWAIALKNFSVFDDPGLPSHTHGSLGMTVMAIGILQPLNALIRPHPPAEGEEKPFPRAAWEVWHKSMGYTACILALVTIAYGTTLVPTVSVQRIYQIAFGVAMALLLLLMVGLRCDAGKFQEVEPKSEEAGGESNKNPKESGMVEEEEAA